MTRVSSNSRRSILLFAILAILATLFITLHQVDAAAVLGIDLGTEWIKVGMVKSGSPIDVILNEQSKRKTSAMVGFRDNDRYFGESARALSTRFPDKMFKYLNLVLGKSFDDDHSAVQKKFDDLRVPIRFVKNEHRGTMDIAVDDKTTYSVEELFAMLFKYIKQLAADSAKGPVADCIITVPAFYSIQQRQAIYDAASVANLRVLSLIHQPTAVALQYGLTKHKMLKELTEPHYVVFYDMGATSTTIALATYFNKTTKSDQIGTFYINGTKWDESLGGAHFEVRLAEHFATQFQKKHGSDVTKIPRAMTRLIESAKKIKEVLSANTETVAMVESLHDDKDFSLPITRDEFETMCSDLLAKVTTPLDALLTEVGISKDKIHTFEVLGGGARIPAIQAALKKYMGKDLSFSLNGDEAIALGSAFHGAYISPSFIVKSFNFKDVFPYKLDFVLSKPSNSDVEAKIITLYNKNEELGSKKTINIPREEDFTVTLKYDEAFAPEGITKDTSLLSEHEVIGVNKVMSNWTFEDERGKKKKVRVSFELTNSGILKFDSASAILEETVTVRVEPKSKKNSTETVDKKESADEKPQYKKEKKVTKVDLETKSRLLAKVKPMSDEDKANAKKRLDSLDQYDTLKRDISRARNALESNLYELRYQLLEDEKYKPFYTEKEADALTKKIDETDAWLSDNDDENVITRDRELKFKDKLKGLTDLSQIIIDRFEQVDLRKRAVQKCRDAFNKTTTYVEKFREVAKHITDEEWSDLLSFVKDTETWVNKTLAKQETSPLNQSPVAPSSEFDERCAKVMEKMMVLVRKPIPKPDISKLFNTTVNAEDSKKDNSTTTETDENKEKGQEQQPEDKKPESETTKKDEL